MGTGAAGWANAKLVIGQRNAYCKMLGVRTKCNYVSIYFIKHDAIDGGVGGGGSSHSIIIVC